MGNTLSILHRLSGIVLVFATLALAFWLVSLAGGEDSYRSAYRVFASPAGLVFLGGCSFAFFYHLFNGLRHLFWDVGWGFERPQRRASGWFAVVGAAASTVALWAFLWHGGRL
jgi:succinate dehydrogenase / fumarate reductase cytochrome b subunit